MSAAAAWARTASGMLALLGLLALFVTWIPAPWHPDIVVPVLLFAGAAGAALLTRRLGRRG